MLLLGHGSGGHGPRMSYQVPARVVGTVPWT
jgi:hypothetical protein